MRKDPVRIGMAGCGNIGQIHAVGLRILAEDREIVPLVAADPSPEARMAVARNCSFQQLTADPLEVIDDADVDAVLITAPTSTHRALVLAAVEAGKPLLCEKPLAPTLEDVLIMNEAVAKSPLCAQVGFHSRFHPIFNRMRQSISSDELGGPMGYTLRDDQYWPTGDVVEGHSSWRSDRSQAGGGALLEHSIHSVDILIWLFGPVRSVQARSRAVFGYDVEDVATLMLEHESGVIGTLLSVFNGVRGREKRRLEAFFEQGTVEITTDFVVKAPEDSYLVQRPDTEAEYLDLDDLSERYFAGLGLERRDFFFYSYVADRSWIRAVRHAEQCSPDFDDALRAHQVIDSAYRSVATGRAVTVADP